MSALSRIPGMAPLISAVASTFALRANPTLRRYNDALAQRFYHHGRLCASNQATVMVLVILFVGMISYPGIVTSYNSSAYARQRSTIHSSVSLSFPHQQKTPFQNNNAHAGADPTRNSPTRSHGQTVGDLDAFWLQKVVSPTWTQDPDEFNSRLPSTAPLHYLAPLVINASNLFDDEIVPESFPEKASLAGPNLFVYASRIQERIQSIVVQYKYDGIGQEGDMTSSSEGSSPASRMVSLRDICLKKPSASINNVRSTGPEDQQATAGCLVHSPTIDNSFSDTLDSSNRRNISQDPLFNLFSGIILGDHSSEHQPNSLVMTFFLRGDLDDNGEANRINATEGFHERIDVKRAWTLIINRLTQDLIDERTGAISRWSQLENDHLLEPTSIEAGSVQKIKAELYPKDPSSQSDGLSIPPHLAFQAQVSSAAQQSGSKRLVSEEYARPRTNISAEYWLLGMAYFVMFLYISLSVGRVDLVKSKYGLGIAAVATVFVSLLMSIGVCSVFGVTLTLMPWEILPFMIIVVGVENINILVHAVVETSMDLPVKERVGRGLGAVGVSITLTLIAELCLLIIGAMTTIPAVQEFCTFAIAAVIMDYVLQMTFFITVISIDIRRLELSDLSARPVYPTYSRYHFGPQHDPSPKSSVSFSSADPTRHPSLHSSAARHSDDNNWANRRDSLDSAHRDDDSKSASRKTRANHKGRIFTSIMMVGVMGYLGYIYGKTSQVLPGTPEPALVSYWRLVSSDASTEFWSLVDPNRTGGYLELRPPAVLTLSGPSSTSNFETDCLDPLSVAEEGCSTGQDDTPNDINGVYESVSVTEGQLDPRRPFRLLWKALLFSGLFTFWLVRVFVIPSIVLAAAILLLLSYLLSPQRKLLVDLQWSFPFIVLPGDYQSKRKLMEEAMLAAEAKELAQNQGPCTPLPGVVDTLCIGGHHTDIDQMDVSAERGYILTSSMDGTILLWNNSKSQESGMPVAQLKERTAGKANPPRGHLRSSSNMKPKGRAVRCLKMHPGGVFAAAGYADGTALIWRCDYSPEVISGAQVPVLSSRMELCRTLDTRIDSTKVRVVSMYFWDMPTRGSSHGETTRSLLMVGYRDGEIWQFDLETGKGDCVIETKLRGGVSELTITALASKTLVDLGLRPRYYLIVAGKDGGIQCWSTSKTERSSWTMRWSHAGMGDGVSVSVLCANPEVPMLATGYSNGSIKVWDLEQGNLVWTLSRGNAASLSSGIHSNFDRRHSQGFLDSHQPSHLGAITRLYFHALELEDGLTGEPAPRVWLVLSSGVDETVMVWVVEWEGLICLPRAEGHDHSELEQEYDSRPTYGYSCSTSSPVELGETESTIVSDLLTSSLPAPRLVGYMKQRGGKSMAVSDACVYGIRRTESSSVGASAWAAKQAHTSVADVSVSSPSFIRSRRKSEGGPTLNTASSASDQHEEGFTPGKRGWELWEADLYQCIFKDPGVWGLDLAVRVINLQPHGQGQHGRIPKGGLTSNGHNVISHDQYSAQRDFPHILVSSNGSAMAVQVPVGIEYGTGDQDAQQFPRPRLQRRPGSFTAGVNNHQQGYVYSTGAGSLSPTSSRPALIAALDQDMAEGLEPTLLPFVEASLIHVVRKPSDSGSGVQDHSRAASGASGRDVVVGFGNWIKIVRLQDEDHDEVQHEDVGSEQRWS
ncbi:hypothetical protein BGZ83_000919 [Gryganskiella cystojenkinii]|nr:hypothetical protein BGZ83_000919 [Gryganskiella cystojenkinii]